MFICKIGGEVERIVGAQGLMLANCFFKLYVVYTVLTSLDEANEIENTTHACSIH